MGFKVEYRSGTDAGPLRGIQEEVACDCWFTSQGRMIPRAIKVQDNDGMLHVIKNIKLLYAEEKSHGRVSVIEHGCELRISDRKIAVRLTYYKDTCRWTMAKI